VEDFILGELHRQRLQIALRRSFAESALTVRLSLNRSVLAQVATKEEAMGFIRAKSEEEVSKAVEAISESVFEQRLDQELMQIDKAVRDRDVRRALTFVPGKELLSKLAPRTGCKNGTDLMRSIKRNLTVDGFAELKELADELRANLAQGHPTEGQSPPQMAAMGTGKEDTDCAR
jgi:ribosomal protein L29